MNPEEGDLRPQLLDRFGLALALGNYDDPLARQAIVRARLAFDADPRAFRASVEAGQRALAERVVQARHRLGLASLSFDDAVHARVSTLCIDAAVDGVRADLVMLRTARALAAWDMSPALTTAHVDAVAELVLYHRRQAPPADASPGTTPDARTGTSPSTPPGTPPAIPPGSHAAPGSRPAGPARMPGAASAGVANPTAEGSEGGEEDDWGALSAPAPAADAIPVAQVKPLRPFGKLPPKKA